MRWCSQYYMIHAAFDYNKYRATLLPAIEFKKFDIWKVELCMVIIAYMYVESIM